MIRKFWLIAHTLIAGVWLASVAGAADISAAPEPTPTGPIEYINPKSPEVKTPKYEGRRYEALAPATLDLAERGGLALNAMTEMLNPNADLEAYWLVDLLTSPPKMDHNFSDHVRTKYLQAYPLCRTISGSTQNLDRERRVLEIHLQMQGPDGFLYTPLKNRPWGAVTGPNEGVGIKDIPKSNQLAILTWDNGRALGAFSIYGLLDPQGPWRDAARRIVDAYRKAIIVQGDIAYLFNPSCEPDWKPVQPAQQPKKYFGATAAQTAHGLSQYGRLHGDAQAVELAAKLMRRTMRDREYFGPHGEFLTEVEDPENPAIHFHSHTMNVLVALEIARATGERELLDNALRAFNWGASHASRSEPLVGYFPEFLHTKVTPAFEKTHGGTNFQSETCEVADMAMCGIILSKLGVDKWEDVDRWIRNQLAENQLMRVDWVTDGHFAPVTRTFSLQSDQYFTNLNVPQRALGGFAGWPTANDWQGEAVPLSIMNCCTVNGAKSLYFIWKEMLDYDKEKNSLTLHLLFNRASRWADVDSYIPYQGRVDIKARQDLNKLAVRVPGWASLDRLRATVDGAERQVSFDGRYAQLGPIKEGQTVSFNFPIGEHTQRANIMGKDYTFVFRGNDVVTVDPPGKYYPTYQRGHYRQGVPLFKKIERFVPDNELAW